MFTELVKADTLAELVARYEQKMRDLADFVPHYEKCKSFLEGDYRGGGSFSHNKTLDKLKKDAWSNVIDKIGLFSMMSIASAKKIEAAFWGDETCEAVGIPDFTFKNVVAFIEEKQLSMPDMFDDKILEVYKILRPGNYYQVLKTNEISSFQGIGKKVILSYYFEQNYSGGIRISYRKREEVNAIQEIFWLLEGKGVPHDDKKLYHALSQAERADAYEDEYFRIKGYNNGNMHLEFKRADLVKKIVIAAKEKILCQPAA